jgi:hypothetical protein
MGTAERFGCGARNSKRAAGTQQIKQGVKDGEEGVATYDAERSCSAGSAGLFDVAPGG